MFVTTQVSDWSTLTIWKMLEHYPHANQPRTEFLHNATRADLIDHMANIMVRLERLEVENQQLRAENQQLRAENQNSNISSH